jgi:FkbM family methyltransferase
MTRAKAAEWLGLLRSLIVYRRPWRQNGLRRLYRPMVGPGDLVFDVGAHLGDRSVAFAALGARVVALEPQVLIGAWLRRLVGTNDRIIVRAEAVGRSRGTAMLAISRRTPTVSTLADAWRKKLPETNRGFRKVRWDDAAEVPVITLDALIEIYGLPRFCKIDVEGHEAEVLAGLSQPIPGVSVEFVSGGLEVAAACIHRLSEIGSYEFNAIEGERRAFLFENWLRTEAIADWLEDGAGGRSSGDIYARLVSSAQAPSPLRRPA